MSIIDEILTQRREIQDRNQIPSTLEIGELQARRLADELNAFGPTTFSIADEEVTRLMDWKDIMTRGNKLYGLDIVGVVWPEWLIARASHHTPMEPERQKWPNEVSG